MGHPSKIEIGTFKQGYGLDLTIGEGLKGLTMYPTPNNPREGIAYSTTGNTEVVVATDQTELSMIETMHHELRHVYLANFGRSEVKGDHGQPGVNSSTGEAMREAKENYRKP